MKTNLLLLLIIMVLIVSSLWLYMDRVEMEKERDKHIEDFNYVTNYIYEMTYAGYLPKGSFEAYWRKTYSEKTK